MPRAVASLIIESIAWRLGFATGCRRKEKKTIEAITNDMGVELFCVTSLGGHVQEVMASKDTSWELPESFQVFRKLELLCLSGCTGSFPNSLASLHRLSYLHLWDCRDLNLGSLELCNLLHLRADGDNFTNESFADFVLGPLRNNLPRLRSLRITNARRLTSFNNVLERQTNDGISLSDLFQKVTFVLHGHVSMLKSHERETGIIAFIRAFKWPSISILFSQEDDSGFDATSAQPKIRQIMYETMLNKSGIRMFFGVGEGGFDSMVPPSLWPEFLVRQRHHRELSASQDFTENDANFLLLKLCSPVLFGKQKRRRSSMRIRSR
jgi:hypothetical protein